MIDVWKARAKGWVAMVGGVNDWGKTETNLKEIDDIYLKKRDSALQTQQHNAMLPYRAVEDHITVLHREFDSRVHAEVAMQVLLNLLQRKFPFTLWQNREELLEKKENKNI
jgi:hypothetical protein